MTKNLRALVLSTAGSILILALLFGAALLLGHRRPSEAGPKALAKTAVHAAVEDIGNESFFEGPVVEEVAQMAAPQEVAVREPALQDVPLAAAGETEGDADVPPAQVEGVAVERFEGPRDNVILGTGAGAGGAFGRGGMRSRSTGGGGRTVARAAGGVTMTEPSEGPEARLPRRSTLAAHAARLRVGEDDHLPLESLRASVRLDGFRARVTLDWIFVNDRDRTLEGTFQVRLPDGATPAVLGFGPALPQAGRLAAAVAVPAIGAPAPTSGRGDEGLRFARFAPRERAGRAYRETARERPVPKDPALLEWAASGVFDTRVYPLTAKSRQRVVFAYDVALVPEGDDLVLDLEFPREGPEPEVVLANAGIAARVTPTPDGAGLLRFGTGGARRVVARLPFAAAPVLQAEDDAAGPLFALVVRPEVPAGTGPTAARAVFLLDVSGSARAARFEAQVGLLERILTANRATLAEFRVAFFDVETEWWRPEFTANTPEAVAALRADASRILVGGATDLGLALDAAARIEGEFDLFLLGDGTATWGERDPAALAERAPRGHRLFGYAFGGAGNDRPLLERLARATGGALFPVDGPAGIAAAATAHTRRPWRIVEAAVEGTEEVLLAGRPEGLFPGTTLTVVGRGRPALGARLVLDLELGGVRQRVSTLLAPRLSSDLALGAYGRVAVEHLEEGGTTLGDLARAYALRLGVVSAAVSLVMLDTDDAYARYGIDAKADLLAIRSSEPGRLSARARADQGARDPRAAFARRLLGPDTDASPPGAGTPFARLLALLPADALRPLPPGPEPGPRSGDVDPRLRALLAAEEPGVAGPFDVATALAGAGDRSGALRALSAIVEAAPGDAALLRAVAFQALAWGHAREAAALLLLVVERSDKAQDALALLGAAFEEAGRPDLGMLAYEAALSRSSALGRVAELRIPHGEYAHLLGRIAGAPAWQAFHAFAAERRAAVARWIDPPEADLAITIAWNTDATDVDLHVNDAAGEDCSYERPRTSSGGTITADIRRGYGPERFLQPRARAGTYTVSVKYFQSDRRRTSLSTFVLATIVEDWGRPHQRTRRFVVPMTIDSQRLEVTRVKRG